MLVASDTSPICNLATIGLLHLLRSQFSEIWIPGAVRCELDRLPHVDALLEIPRAKKSGEIESLGREVEALRTRARFFVSAALTAAL